MTTTINPNNSVFEKTTTLQITFHKPHDYRQGDKNEIKTSADKEELTLGKRIWNTASYRRCVRIRENTRRWLRKVAVPSPLRSKGTFSIPNSFMDQVEAKIQEVKAAYADAADDFAAEYPALIESWKDKLKGQYNRNNYPDPRTIRQRFWVERVVVDIRPAADIDQQEELENAINEIRVFLRQALLQLIDKLANMLGERKDGKKMGFKSEALESFNEWMNMLPDRLVVEDKPLQRLADKAKKILENKSVDDLRDVQNVRDRTRKSLEGVSEKLRGMIKEMPVRSFGFNDED